MINFVKWIFNSQAPVRPGWFSQLCLLGSASFALPGLMTMMTGRILGGFFLLIGSAIPIVLFGLPAWNAYRRSERIQRSHTVQAEPLQSTAVREPANTEITDEYTPLRKDLRDADQQHALTQLGLVLAKMDDFRRVLNLKFNENEVTWHRYLDSGEKVFDGAMNNIRSIAVFGRSVRSIDGRGLVEQLDTLISNGQGYSKAAMAIRERLDMMAEGKQHIDALLGANEEALTALTRVTTKLASVNTDTHAASGVSTTAPIDMEAMIEDLHELAERTERYNARLEADKPTIKLNQ